MAISLTDVSNPNELNTSRASTTIKTHGATTTYTDNTGSATTDYAYHGGASQSYTMMETKEFNPNNMSALTQNDKFETVGHDSFDQVRGMKEVRVFGDFNIITGSPNFFTDGLASKYVEKRNEIPVGPETAEEAYGTISGAKYGNKSTPDPKSGSTVGKTGAAASSSTGSVGGKATTPPEPAVQNRQDVLPLIQQDLTNLEQNMGVGGSIKLMSCKQIHLQAGGAASSADAAIIKPKGRQYPAPFKIDKAEKGDPNPKNSKGKPSTNIVDSAPQTAGPQVEPVEAATASMPFGNISISPGNRFEVNAGTGGLSLISGGTNTIQGFGNTNIMSPAILVQGSQTVDIKGDSNVNVTTGGQTTVKSPETVIHGNVSIRGKVIIKGDLHVQGKFTVSGVAELNETLAVTKNIFTFADVISPRCTLNTHKHKQNSGTDTGAKAITEPPIKG